MNIETLVVTIGQNDHSLAEKMNIQTDSVIGNQCGISGVDKFMNGDRKCIYINSDERGVGRNRNSVMEYATADICILADDDMRFVDGYQDIMKQAVELAPDADIWIFNLIEKDPKRYIIEAPFRVNYSNYAKFGAARIAVKRRSVSEKNISFSLLFGGGAKYGSGEDTLYLKECLDKKLKIVAVPFALAEIDQQSESTWFTGYNDKFFYDKGALYCALHSRAAIVYCIRYLIKYKDKLLNDISFASAFVQMKKGIDSFRKNEVH